MAFNDRWAPGGKKYILATLEILHRIVACFLSRPNVGSSWVYPLHYFVRVALLLCHRLRIWVWLDLLLSWLGSLLPTVRPLPDSQVRQCRHFYGVNDLGANFNTEIALLLLFNKASCYSSSLTKPVVTRRRPSLSFRIYFSSECGLPWRTGCLPPGFVERPSIPLLPGCGTRC